MYTLGLTKDLIDGGQPRAKPHLRKAKPNHVLKPFLALGWPPSTGGFHGSHAGGLKQ